MHEANAKRYYWLKLQITYFNKLEQKKMRKQPRGKDMQLVYLRMMLLSIDKEGFIYYQGVYDTLEEELAEEFDEDVEIVRDTLNYLQENEMISIGEDSACFIPEALEHIGSESYSAERMRRMRTKQKTSHCDADVTTSDKYVTASDEEIELEKEIEKEIEYISSEPDKPTQSPSGILLPLNDNTYYDVPIEKISIWEQAYKAVDVKQELQKMCAWLTSNPTKRKTKRGVDRFINTWLSKEQDRGGIYRTSTYQNESRQQDAEVAERRRRAMEFDWPVHEPRPDDPFQ